MRRRRRRTFSLMRLNRLRRLSSTKAAAQRLPLRAACSRRHWRPYMTHRGDQPLMDRRNEARLIAAALIPANIGTAPTLATPSTGTTASPICNELLPTCAAPCRATDSRRDRHESMRQTTSPPANRGLTSSERLRLRRENAAHHVITSWQKARSRAWVEHNRRVVDSVEALAYVLPWHRRPPGVHGAQPLARQVPSTATTAARSATASSAMLQLFGCSTASPTTGCVHQ